MAERQDWINASGMPSWKYTAAQFEEICGVDPFAYPQCFTFSQDGLVVCLPGFREACDQHFAEVRDNWRSIGVSARY